MDEAPLQQAALPTTLGFLQQAAWPGLRTSRRDPQVIHSKDLPVAHSIFGVDHAFSAQPLLPCPATERPVFPAVSEVPMLGLLNAGDELCTQSCWRCRPFPRPLRLSHSE